MINRGKILEHHLEKSGLNKKILSEKIGVDRSSITRWLREANLDWSKVSRVCEALDIDILKIFPEAKDYKEFEYVSYRAKYIMLLEDYANLNKKYLELLENLNCAKTETKEA